MKSTTILSICLAVLAILVSYFFFEYEDSGNDFAATLAFPVGVAAAFSFGSGMAAFYLVVFLEIICFAFIFYLLIKIIKTLIKKAEGDSNFRRKF